MRTFLKSQLSKEKMLLSYKYNIQGISMESTQEKQVRGINAGVKISQADDEFLKRISQLQGDSKYMRSKTAYAMMIAGIESAKKELTELYGKREISHIIETVNKKDVADALMLSSILKKHGLTLQVKSIDNPPIDKET